MKIALLGYGKMGKMVEEAALAKGHQIVCRMTLQQNNWEEILKADICIDFSHPDTVIKNLKECAHRSKSLVIGTTGWEDHLEEAKKIIKQHKIGVLYAPNCSLGVHVFLKILEYSAKLMNYFTEYDVAGIEFHHSQKKDAPSGTALEICRRLEKSIDRIDHLDMTAIRLGSIPGKHLVMFDSAFDTISICHEARNREGFAKGAVDAAEWLKGKIGFYTLEDFIKGAFHGS